MYEIKRDNKEFSRKERKQQLQELVVLINRIGTNFLIEHGQDHAFELLDIDGKIDLGRNCFNPKTTL